MRNMIVSVVVIYLIVSTACCSSAVNKGDDAGKGLKNFASYLIGNFSSKKQSEADTTYFDINLSMTRIWEEREDGIWLYVEQAVSTQKDKPYRQRIYKLNNPSANKFTSEIYTLRNQQSFVGLQNDSRKKLLLTSDLLELKDGCTVILYHKNGVYEGGTEGLNCPSDLRGAKYATTKIKLSDGVLESWDQGFDSNGKQVWGPTKGSYVFIKE